MMFTLPYLYTLQQASKSCVDGIHAVAHRSVYFENLRFHRLLICYKCLKCHYLQTTHLILHKRYRCVRFVNLLAIECLFRLEISLFYWSFQFLVNIYHLMYIWSAMQGQFHGQSVMN